MKKKSELPSGRHTEKPLKAEVVSRRYTGRLLLRLDPKAGAAAVIRQAKAEGLRLTTMQDWNAAHAEGGLVQVLGEYDGVLFDRLKIVLINEAGAARAEALLAVKQGVFLSVEPERILRKTQAGGARRGKRPGYKDSAAASWGVQAVNAGGSQYTGKGVKLAILDTGFDFTHPDFSGRTLHRKSFIGTRQAQDKEGHGTHCAGIAGGGRKADTGMRYGVAPGARLYIGKILDDAGEGSDGQALAGIEWALEKGCQVISMSLGAQVEEGQAYSGIFEQVAQIAMEEGCLLLAAAGNESDREEGMIGTVNHPANCPSVMAVGGLTSTLEPGNYSCMGVDPATGQVDIAAPGDQILSAKPGGKYQRQSGTSMATAFAAGIAALLWEQHPNSSAAEIWVKLTQHARRLTAASTAVGAGLVCAR